MAQTLAGAIALLGVFILYRVQQIINELKGIAEAAVMELETGPANNLIIVNKKNPQLISRIKKGIVKNDLSGLKECLDEIVSIVDTPCAIIEKFNGDIEFVSGDCLRFITNLKDI